MRIKYFIATVIYLITTFNLFGQIESASKCEILSYLINSKEVDSWFKQFNKFGDSTIVFLDPNNLFDTCKISKWKGVQIRFASKGELIDSVSKYDFHFVIKNRFNYYLIREIKVNSETTLYFHRGYDNLVSYAKIKKRKNRYYLEKIINSVI